MSDEVAAVAGTNEATSETGTLLGATADPVEQPVGETPATTEAKQTDEDAKPAEVEYEFNPPEGVKYDQEALDAFVPLAKELKIPQEQAQKLVDLYAAQVAKAQKAQVDQWQEQIKTWGAQVKTDEEIGGKSFDTSIKAAQTALRKYGSDALREALDSTGMGNHPELIRVFARIGKAMAEDGHTPVGNANGKTLDPAKVLFPTMN